MARISLTPALMFTASLRLVLVGVVAGMLYVPCQRLALISGVLAITGLFSSVWGAGIATWYGVRMKAWRCGLVALASGLPLAFWCWVFYEKGYAAFRP